MWHGLFCLGSRSASLERPPYRCSEGCVLLEQCECLFRFNREHLLNTMLLGLTSVSSPMFLSIASQCYQPSQEDWYHFWALHRPTTQGQSFQRLSQDYSLGGWQFRFSSPHKPRGRSPGSSSLLCGLSYSFSMGPRETRPGAAAQ